MYQKIMVPVDLRHPEKLDKALTTAADLAKLYDALLQLVAVTVTNPTEVAHNPKEFTAKLDEYAAAQTARHGVTFGAHAITSPDPTIDLDERLGREANDIGADLIVMASHVPGFAEYIFSSNAGYLASHAKISVFIVR